MSVNQLVVFDFDWSMADQDTDRWVFEVLQPSLRRKMKDLEHQVQWTDLVAQSLREGHAKGITRYEIENTLRAMPFHPAMVRGVTNLKARGKTTFLCLSNANSVFISTILKARGLENIFDKIITNPADWEPNGLLNLRRRIDPDAVQHQCTVGCSPNMCKGEELTAYLASKGVDFSRIIYIGDGSNDFCPILRMRSQDLVLCRRSRGLQKRISDEGAKKGLAAQVRYWGGAWEVEEVFDTL